MQRIVIKNAVKQHGHHNKHDSDKNKFKNSAIRPVTEVTFF
jgi:hypothetical protein